MGMTMPQTPTPLYNSQKPPATKPCIAMKAISRVAHHWRGVFWMGCRTTPAILSVTVALLNPGAIILSGPGSIALCSNSSIFTGLSFLQLRIRIPQTTQIGGAGPGIQLLKQAIVSRLGLELRHAALGIVDVSERDRLGGAGLHARRDNLAVGDAAIFLFGLDLGGVD